MKILMIVAMLVMLLLDSSLVSAVSLAELSADPKEDDDLDRYWSVIDSSHDNVITIEELDTLFNKIYQHPVSKNQVCQTPFGRF